MDRVRSRVKANGHDVPAKKIKERYARSLKQLLPAMEHCYHAFLFDNTESPLVGEAEPLMFAEMKALDSGKEWRTLPDRTPDWFLRDFLFASANPTYREMGAKVLAARAESNQK